MKYFVTGATGLIGSHVVGQLLEDGHEIIALTRSQANADTLPDAVTVVEGDITEKESMRDAMTGVDGLFHIAAWYFIGPGRREADQAERINIDGTRNVLELMQELEIPKGVYTSTIGVSPPSMGILDESVEPERPDWTVYTRTKWQAHYEVAQPMIDEGLPLVIVQPGFVYGPGDKLDSPVRFSMQSYLKGELPMIPRGWTAPWDHVADIARGHLLAMTNGEPGEAYLIAGESRELVEILECAETLTGIPVPRVVPSTVFTGLASIMKVLERVIVAPQGYASESLEGFGKGYWEVDNAKAKADLGLVHRPFSQGMREYLDWEMGELEMHEVAHEAV